MNVSGTRPCRDVCRAYAIRPYMYQAKFAGGLETPLANAFPAWNLARRSLLMQTNATAWDKN